MKEGFLFVLNVSFIFTVFITFYHSELRFWIGIFTWSYSVNDDLFQWRYCIAFSFNILFCTGIINYYPEGTSMGGHTDHYEEELRQPLIAYSFGQPAVYLIGGDTRDIKPEG